jgi:alanyl-tRNA synthetase
MTEQRERAKADARAKKGGHADTTAYRGSPTPRPTEWSSPATTRWSARAPSAASSGDGVGRRRPREGDEVELVLDRTPFYAEGGGQLADQGVIELDNGAGSRSSTSSAGQGPGRAPGAGARRRGHASAATRAREVDVERRRAISRRTPRRTWCTRRSARRSARPRPRPARRTRPGRFRFDFSATGAVPASVMADVEARVNDLVLADLAVAPRLMTQDEAVTSGAMALFGEKYGDQVRVVSVGDWARELCGGTHAGRSGQLGVIKLLGESSIGSGVRRIEALVGATPTSSWPASTCSSPSSPRRSRCARGAARAGRRHRRAAAHGREGDREGPRRPAAGGRGRRSRRGRGRQRRQGRRPPRRRRRRWRRTHAGARRPRPAAGDRPGVVVVIGVADGKVSVVAAVNDEAARAGLSPPTTWSARSARSSAARAAARTTWPRAAAPTPPVDEALALVGPRSEVGPVQVRPHARHGVRLGIDPGDARIGVARSDPIRVPRDPGRDRPRGDGDLAGSRRSSRRRTPSRSSSGLPRSLSGGEGPAAVKVREFAGALARRVAPVPVRLCDERLTTVTAEAMLRDRGARDRSGAPWSTRPRRW